MSTSKECWETVIKNPWTPQGRHVYHLQTSSAYDHDTDKLGSQEDTDAYPYALLGPQTPFQWAMCPQHCSHS